MVYKKYIKKDGKLYGPYYYHSRRVNGKVISEYHGSKREFDYKKYVFPVIGAFLLIAMGYVLFSLDFGRVSGEVVLDLGANYQEGQPLEGNLRLFLNEGELIPSSSKVIFETNTQSYEYDLGDVVSDQIIDGDFYVSGSSLSGSGSGFGQEGSREVFPVIYFSLNVYSASQPAETTQEPVQEPTPEPAQENQTNVTETQQETVNETVSEPEQPSEEPVQEQTTQEPTIEPSQEEPTPTPTPPEPTQEPTPESPPVEPPLEPAPGLPDVISNFFLAITPTGQVTLELDSTIEGEVAYGNNFILDLLEGQSAEIVPKSVRTDAEELADNVINLDIVGSQVIITTDYSVVEQGFGENYLGDARKELNIDLSGLEMLFDKGTLKVSIVHGQEEIVSLTTLLGEGEVSAQQDTGPVEIQTTNQTQEITPEDNITTNQTTITTATQTIKGLPGNLTEQERTILINEFGDTSIHITKAKAGENKVTIRFELGEFWFEATYDVTLSKEELTRQMDVDKTKWLKDIANSLSQIQPIEQDLEEFLGEQPI